MRVDFSQQLSGRTTITPQLAQQIRLLALSSQELQAEAAQWLQDNVMLEAVEAVEADEEAEPAEAAAAEDEGPELDSNWDDGWQPMSAGGGESAEALPVVDRLSDAPLDVLLRELPVECAGERQLAACHAVLEAVDERGWLECSLHDIACATGFSTGELVSALALIQRLAPAGFGARDLEECFSLQLRSLPESPARDGALRLIEQGLERLARRELASVQRAARLDDAGFAAALQLLRRLDPHPGRGTPAAAPVYPDVVVAQSGGRWTVTLSEHATPRLRVNAGYARAVEEAPAAAQALRAQLAEARWILRGLEQRADTLLKVAHAIFVRQFRFLAEGDEALAPMTLREIAGEVGVHESTVSRVTSNKYVLTPRGTFELKHFFGAGLGCQGQASNTAARALVRRFISAEAAHSPLDDATIARQLAERGIRIARRTVAKYREGMGIPPARLRGATVHARQRSGLGATASA